MGVKGKLTVSVEVKCGGHLVHDLFHMNTHHIANITPKNVNCFEIHEGRAFVKSRRLNKLRKSKGAFAFARGSISVGFAYTNLGLIRDVREGSESLTPCDCSFSSPITRGSDRAGVSGWACGVASPRGCAREATPTKGRAREVSPEPQVEGLED
ncbi:hypothetical protein MTR67_035190 [Solanum verrucosum]|uniref:Uncharacterized protein n=1 Tax=Solanum verrucosum TaxID=315347 RepID=A0AAF0U9U7_SOLVR|nr:hypothetical protein MTR67_035190 [Solanum verrucosum]